jgi:hypothetical protein
LRAFGWLIAISIRRPRGRADIEILGQNIASVVLRGWSSTLPMSSRPTDVTLIRCFLHATIEHDTDDALALIRRYIGRALPGTTSDDLRSALERIMAATKCIKSTLH